MNIQRKNKGFTIIEVVLVLAIAGLIFMMVFIALPSLQRSQRDTQRKNDVSRLETAISSYTSNNRGSLPVSQADWDGFESSYLLTNNDSFVDPSGAGSSGLTGPVVNGAQSYLLKASTSDLTTTLFADSQNIIYYAVKNICDPSSSAKVTTTGAGARKVAFRMVLEGGGVDCVNN